MHKLQDRSCKMNSSQKLDWLMKLTDISNRTLAQKINLDASYLSKLRHGSRRLSMSRDYISDLCTVILKHGISQGQRKAICDKISITSNATDQEITDLMIRWLCTDDDERIQIHEYSSISSVSYSPDNGNFYTHGSGGAPISLFYGNKGRQQSAQALLGLLITRKAQTTLLLYFDEKDDWLYSDNVFFGEWCSLLLQLCESGSRIKLIFNISRDLNKMFDVIKKLGPLCLTGKFEIYYYPRLRDEVHKRSLTVAPGIAALFTSSIAEQSADATSFLVHEIKAVNSLADEFYSYLSLCKPLIEVFDLHAAPSPAPKLLRKYLSNGPADILYSNSLTATTLPKRVLKTLRERLSPDVIGYLEQLHAHWNSYLTAAHSKSDTVHIIKLRDIKGSQRVPLSCLGILEQTQLFYENNEYRKHLEYLLWMLNSFKWFDIVISNENMLNISIHIFKKEMYVFNEKPPFIAIKISEPNLILAFREFLKQMTAHDISNRHEVKQLISEYIKQL